MPSSPFCSSSSLTCAIIFRGVPSTRPKRPPDDGAPEPERSSRAAAAALPERGRGCASASIGSSKQSTIRFSFLFSKNLFFERERATSDRFELLLRKLLRRSRPSCGRESEKIKGTRLCSLSLTLSLLFRLFRRRRARGESSQFSASCSLFFFFPGVFSFSFSFPLPIETSCFCAGPPPPAPRRLSRAARGCLRRPPAPP